MDAQQFFLAQHATMHGVVDQIVLAGLAEADLRRVPADGQNSLAWLLSHALRWEDVMVNAWLAGAPQVFDAQDWWSRLGVGTRRVGTAMTVAEVHDVSVRVDLEALRAYRAATVEATRAAVGALSGEDLTREITVDRLQVAVRDGAYGKERAGWMDAFWTGHDVAWFLSFANLHGSEHLLGEALAVRTQLGVPLGL